MEDSTHRPEDEPVTERAASLHATPLSALPSRHPVAVDSENTIKTLAKVLARDATADIADRHLRAQVRTNTYNRIVQLLRQIDTRRIAQQRWYRRALTILGSATLLLSAALATSLAL